MAEHTVGHTVRTSRENSLLENGGNMRILVDLQGGCMIKHMVRHSVHNHTRRCVLFFSSFSFHFFPFFHSAMV
jgi:hypothetical protein